MLRGGKEPRLFQSLPEPPPCADLYLPLCPTGSGPGPCPDLFATRLDAQRTSLTRCRQPVPPFGDAQLHPLAGSGSELRPQPVRRKRVSLLLGCPHPDRPSIEMPETPSACSQLKWAPWATHPKPISWVHHSLCRKHKSNQYFSQGHVAPTRQER